METEKKGEVGTGGLSRMSSNGKGSTRRPTQVSAREYAENWERTFGENYSARSVRFAREQLVRGLLPGATGLTATAHKAKRTSRR